MKKEYKCLYNHELFIAGTSQTPYQSYDEEIKDEQIIGLIEELADTDVDAVMFCPTAMRRKLWFSEVDRHWQDEAPYVVEPPIGYDFRYYEKAYYRWRRYMLLGKDPVGLTVKTAHNTGKAIFLSYRMNDNHAVWDVDSPTNDTFWRTHPELKLKGGAELWSGKHCYNYLYPEVREVYYNILHELMEMYDFDGIELDFMRHRCFFEEDDILKGIPVMTEFVGSIKKMLQEFEVKRGKELPLCVRVPHRFEDCLKIGLDVKTWDEMEIVDMINISPHFIMNSHLDIETFKAETKHARLYGEMHFQIQSYEKCLRKTNREIYRTHEYNILSRGCDGVSFFNFAYCRNHYLSEPRRLGITDHEPPFEALRNIDIEVLKSEPKQYFENISKFGNGQVDNYRKLEFYIAKNEGVQQSIARIGADEKILDHRIKVIFNGVELKEILWVGELFVPQSIEALQDFSHTRYFEVPVDAIQLGNNIVELINELDSRHIKWLTFTQFEMALYTNPPFMK